MQPLSPLELLRLVRKRRLCLVLPVLAGIGVAVLVSALTVPIYLASTLILVESPKVPTDYVKATVTTDLQERLRTIEQQITSRNNLERIISEMRLHPDLVADGKMDEATLLVRRALAVQVQRGRIFQIDFKDPDPAVAAETANLIANLFIQENLKLRELQARNTSAFLEAELETIKKRLEAQEAVVARYRLDNTGSLPEQRQSNLAAIAHLETRLDINLEGIESAEMKRILLQREAEAGLADDATETPRSRRQALQLELARLESRYTDRHPDVVRLRSELKALERESGEGDETPPWADRTPDPALATELEAVDLEIQRLRSERERLLADIALYQGRLEATPLVEQRLLILTRDYDNIQDAYQSLLSKRLDARLAENLEQQRQSEQFRILEAALPPTEPHWPDVPLLLLAGIAVGGLAGLGLALLREHTDQSFQELEALQEAFPSVNVMASIPLVRGARRARLRREAGSAGGVT